MYTYKNRNTGHVVSSETVWHRLETLSNWERTSGPAEESEQAAEQAAEPDGDEALGDEHDQAPTEDEALPRPTQNASKEAWVEYVCLTNSNVDEATATAMTKAELIAYGQDGE